MEKANKKQSAEILAEIYRNAQLALQSISNVLPEVEDEEIKKELLEQHEAYERFSSRASVLAKDRDIEVKEPNPMKKAMMWGSIKMSTMADNSPSHIADMMIQGTVMGITALRKSEGEAMPEGDDEIYALLNEMIAAEEEFEKIWKSYL